MADVRLWWEALTGDPLDLDEREDVVLGAASVLGILPSFELVGRAEPPDLHWEWEGSFERGGAPDFVLERSEWIGSDPYLVVAEVAAVGLLSCRGHRPEALSTLLLDRTQHGDLWALIARDLSRALVVNWDDESLTDDGLCWLQARWVGPSARSAGIERDRNGVRPLDRRPRAPRQQWRQRRATRDRAGQDPDEEPSGGTTSSDSRT